MSKAKKKIGLVFDSSSNLDLETARKKNIGFVPLNIVINGEAKKAGIEIRQRELYEIMQNKNTIVKTSTPDFGYFIEVFDQMLKEYEKIIFLGISKDFSGTVNAAKSVVENNSKYKSKVFVYDSLYSSPWTEALMNDLIKIVDKNNDIEQIFEKFDYQVGKMTGYLAPKNLYWLHKGGRLPKHLYLIANTLRVIPIIKIKDGKIDSKELIKSLSVNGAIKKIVKQIEKDKIVLDQQNLKYEYLIISTGNQEIISKLKHVFKTLLDVNEDEIKIYQISVEQVAHMGPEAFGAGIKVNFK